MESGTRVISEADAAELTNVLVANARFLAPWQPLVANARFLAPWQPLHDDSFFSVDARRAAIAGMLAGYERGEIVPLVITSGGRIIGQITLAPIIRGVLLSTSIGYWVAETHNGRGHATRAIGAACGLAFDQLALHRVEAPVMAENLGSVTALERNGFRQYGVATRYLKIAGNWRDHLMFEHLSDDQART